MNWLRAAFDGRTWPRMQYEEDFGLRRWMRTPARMETMHDQL